MEKKEAYLLQRPPIARELLWLFDQNDEITVFDIGSCEGLDSIRYKKLFPNSRIYAFEPLPSNVTKIRSNLNELGLSDVAVIQEALSDTAGKQNFFVSSSNNSLKEGAEWNYGNKSSSLLEPDKHLEIYDWCKFDEQCTVKTSTLDEFASGNMIETIHLIHMDVQGAELMVLKGGKKSLANIFFIWVEVGNIALYKGQPKKKEVHDFLKQNNFSLVKEIDSGGYADRLYINTKLLLRISPLMLLLVKMKSLLRRVTN